MIECSTSPFFTTILSSKTVGPDTTSFDYGPLSAGTYFFRIMEVSGTPATGDSPAIAGADSPCTTSSTTANVGSINVAISSVDDAAELGPRRDNGTGGITGQVRFSL